MATNKGNVGYHNIYESDDQVIAPFLVTEEHHVNDR